MLELDRLRPHDRARVAELLEATGAFSSDEIDVALELFDDSHAGAGARSGDGEDALADYELIGAYDDERLLGYVCFGPTPATEGTYDLYWLAVDPAAQGRGVGRALLRRAEALLAERGGRLILVETSSRADYAPTREFYARSGYTEVARVRDFYAPADDRIMLTTRLTARERGAPTR
jgi:ribosomal protein S18 acetylase RimI-like enzyme